MTSGRERSGSATLHVCTRNMPFSQNNCPRTVKVQYKKGVANRAYHGPKIPGGGKCTRPGGICEAKAERGVSEELEVSRIEVPEALGNYLDGLKNDESDSEPEGGDQDRIYEIPLEQIRPAPWNPPARMDPQSVQELADSIALHGQQSPGLVRPIEGGGLVGFELVFGHRRYAALQSKNGCTIPFKAFVRPMSEADAMILSGVENLQRQGFSDIEEAEFFRTCGERYGESAVGILAEKLSVSDRYVRKRIEILKLPEDALKLWRDGSWHVGHMEQLLRIGSTEEVEAWFQEARTNQYDWQRILNSQVFELRERIDRMAIPLSHARFNKADCKVCRKNTSVQLSLFGGEKNKTCCLDQKCFMAKQQAWLDLHWADGSCKANKELTRMAVIGDWQTPCTGKFGWQDRGGGQVQPGQKCGDCPKYGTILNHKCESILGRVCFGDKTCFDVLKRESQGGTTSGKAAGKEDQGGPRVAWHGEHFRQEFYMKEAPGLCAGLLTEDPRRLHLALAAFCYRHRSHLAEWLFERIGVGIPTEMDRGYQRGHTMGQFLEGVKKLRPLEVEQLMAEAVIMIAFHRHGNYSDEFQDDDRAAIAHFIGVDFDKWEPTDEWFEKKTKAEIISYIVRESGLIENSEFLAYLNSEGRNIGTDAEGIGAKLSSKWKKGDLVELIKNCGVDLSGRLPDEIKKKPEGNEYAD